MWPWTATTRGYVYLFHFARPLGNPDNPRAQAHHYVGFAVDLAGRLTDQFTGRGAAIVRAAVERKIAFDVYFWPATLAVEKLIKRRKETHVFCPTCCRLAGRRLRPIPQHVEQLTLPLDDDELPQVAPGPVDWYEIQTLQRWRAARVPYSTSLPDDWDDGLL